MGRFLDLTGQKFGRLTAIERSDVNTCGRVHWLCKCECGNFTVVSSNQLRRGATRSCGCLSREQISERFSKHRKRETKLYVVWAGMKGRCHVPSNASYKFYGARGIEVCQEWRADFMAFHKWAYENGYEDGKGLTIDRIDGEKGYSPDNCRWITIQEQQKNKKNTRLIEYNGKKQTLPEWSKELGISESTIKSRLGFGWTVEDAFTIPPKKSKS